MELSNILPRFLGGPLQGHRGPALASKSGKENVADSKALVSNDRSLAHTSTTATMSSMREDIDSIASSAAGTSAAPTSLYIGADEATTAYEGGVLGAAPMCQVRDPTLNPGRLLAMDEPSAVPVEEPAVEIRDDDSSDVSSLGGESAFNDGLISLSDQEYYDAWLRKSLKHDSAVARDQGTGRKITENSSEVVGMILETIQEETEKSERKADERHSDVLNTVQGESAKLELQAKSQHAEALDVAKANNCELMTKLDELQIQVAANHREDKAQCEKMLGMMAQQNEARQMCKEGIVAALNGLGRIGGNVTRLVLASEATTTVEQSEDTKTEEEASSVMGSLSKAVRSRKWLG